MSQDRKQDGLQTVLTTHPGYVKSAIETGCTTSNVSKVTVA